VDPTSIRARIRGLLDSRAIPCEEPETLWAGGGTGGLCLACSQPIATTDVEYEVEFAAATPVLHDLGRGV
jgi:hypothetical protein